MINVLNIKWTEGLLTDCFHTNNASFTWLCFFNPFTGKHALSLLTQIAAACPQYGLLVLYPYISKIETVEIMENIHIISVNMANKSRRVQPYLHTLHASFLPIFVIKYECAPQKTLLSLEIYSGAARWHHGKHQ